MGIKLMKETLDIKFIVQRTKREGKDVICIGSAYVHNLITLATDGCLVGSSPILQPGDKSEIGQVYSRVMAAFTDGSLQTMLAEPDTFGPLVPSWTSNDWGKVYCAWAEEFGWPNTTTTGELQYDNSHFRTRAEALARARKGHRGGLKDLWRWQIRNLWADATLRIKMIVAYGAQEVVATVRLYLMRGY